MNRISPPDRMTILVVDEDAEFRSAMAEVLQNEGCRVVQAHSGAHALEVLRAVTPDLIILDLALPGMSGRELMRVLRTSTDLSAIPLAVLSASPVENDLGDTPLFRKPIDLMTLLRLLDMVDAARPAAVRPLLGSEGEGTKRSAMPIYNRVHRSILIVEDDRDIAIDLAALFREQGFRVHVATDGADALRQLDQGVQPSAIILDLMMPVMDGWTLRRELLARPAAATIPVVVLTGVDNPENSAASIGAASIFSKPFAFEPLLAVVDRQCGSSPAHG